MEGALIRLATEADIPAVQNCAQDAYAQYVPLMGQKPAPMVQDFTQVQQNGHLWVTDPFAGFIVMYPTGTAMHLENVAVLPNHAGQGIGRALIGFCENTARSQGLHRVELYTNIHMTANQIIYPRMGYTEVDRRHENGFDRIYYAKALGSFSV